MVITFNLGWETVALQKGREHQKYYTKDGTHVVGVTTVLGELSKSVLLRWAAKLEREGVEMCTKNGTPIPQKYFHEIKRDDAADIGTVSHFISECWLNKRNPELEGFEDEFIEKAILSFEKFKAFWQSNRFRLAASEVQLVSETGKYGGTIDIVAFNEQENYVLMDLKTSKDFYSSQLYQLAAYSSLWHENGKPRLAEHMIVRIGKEDPDDFEVKHFTEDHIEKGMKVFMHALGVRNESREINEMFRKPYYKKIAA